MIFALDSNVISYMLRSDTNALSRYREEEKNGHDFVIPAIVFYEVQRGLLAKKMDNRLLAFEKLCNSIKYVDFNKHVWQKTAELYARLRQQGNLIDDADLFIAAFCIINEYTLVTNNENHFSRISELAYVNWV